MVSWIICQWRWGACFPGDHGVNYKDHRFGFWIGIIGLLVCGMITAYYAYFVPTRPKLDLRAIQKILNLDIFTTESELDIPGTTRLATQQGSPDQSNLVQKTMGTTPSGKLPKAEFTEAHGSADANKAGTTPDRFAFRTVLPPSKLSVDMFAFSSLPFDAPVAEFPLVLVWQKNLEWAKTMTGDRVGAWKVGPGSLTPGSIYGKAPPGTPPSRPPGPPGPPGPPPRPPPEVSTSGL